MTVIVVGCQVEHQMTIAVMRKGEPMDDLIKRQDAIDALDKDPMGGLNYNRILNNLPSAQKTAKRIVGRSRSGLTMWLECDMCHEPIDIKDAFCRRCGRRFEDG